MDLDVNEPDMYRISADLTDVEAIIATHAQVATSTSKIGWWQQKKRSKGSKQVA